MIVFASTTCVSCRRDLDNGEPTSGITEFENRAGRMLVLCESCGGPGTTWLDVRDALVRGVAQYMQDDPSAIRLLGGRPLR